MYICTVYIDMYMYISTTRRRSASLSFYGCAFIIYTIFLFFSYSHIYETALYAFIFLWLPLLICIDLYI